VWIVLPMAGNTAISRLNVPLRRIEHLAHSESLRKMNPSPPSLKRCRQTTRRPSQLMRRPDVGCA
jgi:hypothetical protein